MAAGLGAEAGGVVDDVGTAAVAAAGVVTTGTAAGGGGAGEPGVVVLLVTGSEASDAGSEKVPETRRTSAMTSVPSAPSENKARARAPKRTLREISAGASDTGGGRGASWTTRTRASGDGATGRGAAARAIGRGARPTGAFVRPTTSAASGRRV